MIIDSIEKLRALYPSAKQRAIKKQLTHLEQHSHQFIKLSPFVVLSTVDSSGQVDASPRGGSPGFVKVLSPTQILIPDARGNNRLDSISNIIETGQVGTLFMIPGVDETLRINGRATVSTSADLLSLFHADDKRIISVIDIQIESVFLHCAKAFMRSKLWSSEAQIERGELPSMGQMLNDQMQVEDEPESQADMVARYQADI
ncbi:pyridoxamine 5'-phosphate oxidase family protein [Pleionea sp. CnH1-48]|uniref:pyridoxamine 5'-phosphate oxidase family protein n=1 Tax=Pleionea sp. CnH1-48 TaxID=2954494 RepID=UPI002096E853|nr:pyridoxamine 5'-phosphate oxidase family protein [Pleionea sp. CnH1-48]MCO7224181.1 pyridoxamine 5'-phosphate oxidase family protein [Pleionea sp. CnH1-48]